MVLVAQRSRAEARPASANECVRGGRGRTCSTLDRRTLPFFELPDPTFELPDRAVGVVICSTLARLVLPFFELPDLSAEASAVGLCGSGATVLAPHPMKSAFFARERRGQKEGGATTAHRLWETVFRPGFPQRPFFDRPGFPQRSASLTRRGREGLVLSFGCALSLSLSLSLGLSRSRVVSISIYSGSKSAERTVFWGGGLSPPSRILRDSPLSLFRSLHCVSLGVPPAPAAATTHDGALYPPKALSGCPTAMVLRAGPARRHAHGAVLRTAPTEQLQWHAPSLPISRISPPPTDHHRDHGSRPGNPLESFVIISSPSDLGNGTKPFGIKRPKNRSGSCPWSRKVGLPGFFRA